MPRQTHPKQAIAPPSKCNTAPELGDIPATLHLQILSHTAASADHKLQSENPKHYHACGFIADLLVDDGRKPPVDLREKACDHRVKAKCSPDRP